MWQWLRNVLLPGIYQGDEDLAFSNSTTFTGEGDTVLVGMPRLRQLRVKKGAKTHIYLLYFSRMTGSKI